MNNEQLKQSAKDQAAREIYNMDFDILVNFPSVNKRGLDLVINRAMEIYAEMVAVEFADWIAQNCRMYENEFSLYNLNEDVLEIRPVSELYELFNLFKTTKP